MTKKVLKKIIKNNVEYYLPEWWSWWSASVNHLEENCLIWERYTLNNLLFRQITPEYDNCNTEIKVGDVAADNQIHIQRLWSWKASNSLKLKLKKTWSPWDLTVWIMKGVQVNVSDTEAYWYWDWTVIATGTVSSSVLTTSFQEITVWLNNEVWWTEWELLDIVLKIPSVNSSNYVVVWCDSTQWSEWFSYVKVNWTTRTRDKLMPYCVSNAFTSDMLVKVSSDTIAFNDNTRIFSWSWTVWPNYSASTVKTKIWEITIPLKNNLKITYNTSWDDWQYKFVYLNDDMVSRVTWNWSYNVTVDKDANTYEIFAWWQSFSSRASAFVKSVVIDRLKIYVWKTWIWWNPSSVKSIWERLAILIFWINKDSFYLWEEVSSASSWTIAPSNFVWYIKMWKYKIPYYV